MTFPGLLRALVMWCLWRKSLMLAFHLWLCNYTGLAIILFQLGTILTNILDSIPPLLITLAIWFLGMKRTPHYFIWRMILHRDTYIAKFCAGHLKSAHAQVMAKHSLILPEWAWFLDFIVVNIPVGGAEVYHRSNEIQCAIDIKNCSYKYRIIHISTEIILQKKNLTS